MISMAAAAALTPGLSDGEVGHTVVGVGHALVLNRHLAVRLCNQKYQ